MISRRGYLSVFVLAALFAMQGANLPAQSASKSAPATNADARCFCGLPETFRSH